MALTDRFFAKRRPPDGAAAGEARETAHRLVTDELLALGISPKRAEAILRVTDLDAVAVTDGALADAEGVRSRLAQEWADFIPTQQTVGAAVASPPVGMSCRMTAAQIAAIADMGKRHAAIAENMDLFLK